jgi:hypothetical protein
MVNEIASELELELGAMGTVCTGGRKRYLWSEG